jgi:hypothetical protein
MGGSAARVQLARVVAGGSTVCVVVVVGCMRPVFTGPGPGRTVMFELCGGRQTWSNNRAPLPLKGPPHEIKHVYAEASGKTSTRECDVR